MRMFTDKKITTYCRLILFVLGWVLLPSYVCAQNVEDVMQAVKDNIVNDSVDLDEVVIKGTKVKFYFKKDTLLYDAANFKTEKGAVLAKLIEQLPGVDIRSDGSIYVGGKQVDVLLLNGKDFFDKDRHTILDNLPTFMVKEFKVYDHKGDSSSMINREQQPKGLVMDVKLKKEYNHNYVANIYAGGGTDNHYTLGLFGLLISPNSRLSGYATSNDLNQAETYLGSLSIQKFGSGEVKSTSAGVRYNWDDNKKGDFTISGLAQLNLSDKSDLSRSYYESFYSTGNTYSRNFSKSESKDLSFRTYNSLILFGSLNTKIIFDHTKSENTEDYATANLSSEQANDNLGEYWEDSISSLAPGETLLKHGITRRMSQYLRKQEKTNLYFNAGKTFYIPNTENKFTVDAEINSISQKANNYRHNRYEYFKSGQPTDWRNEYHKSKSNFISTNLSTSYHHEFGKFLNFDIGYNFRHQKIDSDSPLFLLERLDGWGNAEMYPLGTLPDKGEMESAIDAINSSWKRSQYISHNLNAKLSYHKETRKSDKETFTKDFSLSVPLHIVTDRLKYRSIVSDTSVHQTYATQEVYISSYISNSSIDFRKKSWKIGFSYNYNHETPAIQHKLHIRNTSNPHFISEGNDNLRISTRHSSSISATYRNDKWDASLKMNGVLRRNSITEASIYNEQTGVTVTRPMNVDGYWDMSIKLDVTRMFGSEMKSNLKFSPLLSITNNVGLVGNANSTLYKNTVRRHEYGGKLAYRGHISYNNYINLGVYGTMISSTGNRWQYKKQNVARYGFDLNLSYTLPWKIELLTNFSSSNYAGYSDNSMNINECIWDMSVRKLLFDGNIEVEAIAKDLLNQKSLISYHISSTYQRESWNNYMRRYFLLKVKWNLHTKEK